MKKDILLLIFQLSIIVGFILAYSFRDKSKDKEKTDNWWWG
jgi:hypothetical protein